MDVDKFKKYWESIGKPEFEWRYPGKTEWRVQWGFSAAAWPNNYDYRIKDDPHWELRSRWVDSDFTLPLEVFIQSDEYGDDRWVASKKPSWRADLKFREAIRVDDEGWIPNEGVMPVDGTTLVEAKQVSGHTCIAPAKNISWSGLFIEPDNQIAAYRVVSHDPKVTDDDGWIPHTPGYPMPVADDVLVEAKRRDGGVLPINKASTWNWGNPPGNERAEIIAYKIHKSCPPEEPKKFGTESAHFDGVNEYGVNHPMYQGFMDAIDQATGGKGQRHGGATVPFLEQRWHNISKSTGFRGLVYQAVKKAEEATEKPDYESFERELLGAMVYLNMALIHVRKYGYTTEVKIDG